MVYSCILKYYNKSHSPSRKYIIVTIFFLLVFLLNFLFYRQSSIIAPFSNKRIFRTPFGITDTVLICSILFVFHNAHLSLLLFGYEETDLTRCILITKKL